MPYKKSKIQNPRCKIVIQKFKFLVLSSGFALCVLSFMPNSYATPCYGTNLPKKKEIFMGFQTHTIFKRYLKGEYGKLRSQQEFLLLSCGVYDWLSIDLKGGSGYIKQHPAGSDELDYPSFLGGGYGFRLKLHDEKNVKVVFGFQHISIHPKTISIEGKKHKAVLDDWQFSGLLSYNLKKITPYLGGKWSRLDYIHWVDGDRKRVKSDLTKDIGLVLGLDVWVTKQVWFNLEGQLFDNEALAFSANYNF